MLKIKPLTEQQLLISIDRLTRFKNPETKYLRVFKDILINNLINPKFKKIQLDEMGYDELKTLAEKIINFSLQELGWPLEQDYTINQRLYDYETNTFVTDNKIQLLLKNKINYKACLNLIKNDAPINLLWLKNLAVSQDLISDRETHFLKFPLEKVVISEGITEEILIPEFAKLCGYDFERNGIQMISAGGKNQVVKLFYRLSEILNIELIKKTLSYGLKNISMIELESVNQEIGMVKILEEIFKHRGMHEFKKSEFAYMVKENLNSENDLSPEIKNIVKEIAEIKITKKIKH